MSGPPPRPRSATGRSGIAAEESARRARRVLQEKSEEVACARGRDAGLDGGLVEPRPRRVLLRRCRTGRGLGRARDLGSDARPADEKSRHGTTPRRPARRHCAVPRRPRSSRRVYRKAAPASVEIRSASTRTPIRERASKRSDRGSRRRSFVSRNARTSGQRHEAATLAADKADADLAAARIALEDLRRLHGLDDDGRPRRASAGVPRRSARSTRA